MKNEFGFHVCFLETPKGNKGASYYAFSGTDFANCAWINFAGGKKRLAKALFVRLREMTGIIRSFFASGERSKEVAWLATQDIPWKTFERYQ
jgi:hypothetical protein